MNGAASPSPAHPKGPAKDLPPIRMGGQVDVIRKRKAKAAAQAEVAVKVRTKIYQELLALLDIAERMTLDCSSLQDRYRLDWEGLGRQIRALYRGDVLEIIPGLQEMILSKAGARGLPTALYRQLLQFSQECEDFLKWARIPDIGDPIPSENHPADPARNRVRQACEDFKKACAVMRQQICIFENERAPGEESFFG